MNLGATELIIVLVILLVLFGGAKLPKLARSLGQAQKEFKQGVTDSSKGDDKPEEQSSGDTGEQPKNS
ncbi:MAG: twin-arginine translocase TatA/TatE family subunit [bacterium]|nr:twin-arginine translocase TatA/TatE family subunit [bacterium]